MHIRWTNTLPALCLLAAGVQPAISQEESALWDEELFTKAGLCDGIGDHTWNGCRGNGCAVCGEKLNGYDCYLGNHPDCVLNSTCANSFFDCDAACPAPSAADACACDGIGDGIWNGCRGTGCHVCQEKLAGFDCYFLNHPSCKLNTTCAGSFFSCDAACPPPSAADVCPTGGVDSDADGISDALEEQLARRFAPIIRLYPTDEFRPSSAPWYMARTHMRFHHSNCSDHQILNLGTITNSNISTRSHQNTGIPPFCIHSGSTEFSDLRTSPSRFFLQIPNDANELTTRLGAPPTDWTCYAHVRRAPSSSDYDVQYWLFFPYNGDSTAGAGAHEGDWEHVTVRISSSGTAISQMYFSAHDNEGRWYAANQLLFSGGRPVAYSAWHSHASYPYAQTWNRSFPLPADYTADGGPAWDCQVSLRNTGERGLPPGGLTFLNYSGRWGEIGAFGGSCGGLCFSGPWGPYLQTYWSGD